MFRRKSDKIKNDLDFDIIKLEQARKIEINLEEKENDNKPKLFDETNKFDKYSAINIKNNRRL